MGRHSKLTPEVQEKIVGVLRSGNYAQVAAQCAGIGETTFYRWLQQGEEEESGIYRDFREAVKNAEAEAEADSVAIIETAGRKEWQARAWLLERKHPYRWGRFERQEHMGSGVKIVLVDETSDKETVSLDNATSNNE